MKNSKKQFLILIAMVVAFSAIPSFSFAASKLKAPALHGYSAGGHSVVNYWNKVKGAKGYQLYRATKKNGKYQRIVSTKNRKYKDKNLEYDKKYYYKVRAYKTVKGKKKYGSFSKIVRTIPYSKSTLGIDFKVYEHKDKSKYQKVKITNKCAYPIFFFDCSFSYEGYNENLFDSIDGAIYKVSGGSSTYPRKIMFSPGVSATVTCKFKKAKACKSDSVLCLDGVFNSEDVQVCMQPNGLWYPEFVE